MTEHVPVDRDCPMCGNGGNGFLYFARRAGVSEPLTVECEECLGAWTLKTPEALGPGYGPFVAEIVSAGETQHPASLDEVRQAGYERLIALP